MTPQPRTIQNLPAIAGQKRVATRDGQLIVRRPIGFMLWQNTMFHNRHARVGERIPLTSPLPTRVVQNGVVGISGKLIMPISHLQKYIGLCASAIVILGYNGTHGLFVVGLPDGRVCMVAESAL